MSGKELRVPKRVERYPIRLLNPSRVGFAVNQMQPGDSLPNERQLWKTKVPPPNVRRGTVREALKIS